MKTAFRMTIASSLALCLILISITFGPSNAKAEVALTVDADIDDGARQFDEAVKDIETILTLDLSNEAAAKQATNILKRNEKKLAHYEKKALQAAKRSSTFEKGIKQEAQKRKGGATELAEELRTKPDAIEQIPGAEEAAEAIKNSTKPAADVLQRVSEAFSQAADKIKKKHAHANLRHDQSLTSVSGSEVSALPTAMSPVGFCGPYARICDLLRKLGYSYLRQAVSELADVGLKELCVVGAYGTYLACVVTSPFDLLNCASKFASRVSNCLRFT